MLKNGRYEYGAEKQLKKTDKRKAKMRAFETDEEMGKDGDGKERPVVVAVIK